MYHLIYILTIGLFLLCTQGVNCDNSDKPVCKEKLGVGNRHKITDDQLTASSDKGEKYSAKHGRLYERSARGWCADVGTKGEHWFQVDFKDTKTITSVETGGLARDKSSYVKTFALKYSYDSQTWHNYTLEGKEVILKKDDADSEIPIKFPHPVTARLIRIYPRTWGTGLCLKVEFSGCTPQEDCITPAGMEDKRIADHQVNASSFRSGHFPRYGRLHNRTARRGTKIFWGAWCSAHSSPSDQNIFLQIDLLWKRNISRVATQGYAYELYVQKYRLNYSTDGVSWLSCHNKQKQIEFEGNTDNDTVKGNFLDPFVTARYIRFNPIKWHGGAYACMRVEIYECLPVNGSVPDVVGKRSQRVVDVSEGSKTRDDDLQCTMKGQAGIIINWYRKDVLVKTSRDVKVKNVSVGENRVRSILLLSNVSIKENGVIYECRGQYPGVISQYTSIAILLRVGVDQPPLRGIESITTASSLAFDVSYRLANITKKYEFEYRAVNTSKWAKQSFSPKENNIYNIKKLQPWTTYEVRVTPVHRDGHPSGRTSETKKFTTLQGVPDPPVNVRTSRVTTNNATIKWDIPPKNKIRGMIKRFIVKVVDGKGDPINSLKVVDSRKCTIAYLLPGENYIVKVAIENERKQSSFVSISFTTREGNEPLTTQNPLKKINLEKLNRIKIDDNNAVSVAIDVKNLTSKPDQLNPQNVSTTAEILKKIVGTKTKNSEVGDNILETVSNMLDVENDVLEKSNSSSEFIKILEDFVENGGEFSKNTSNVKIRILSDLSLRSGVVQQKFNKLTIVIPKEVLNAAENKTMYFIYYKNGKLFKGSKRLIKEICMENGFTENVYQESTGVMSSGIPGLSIRNLSEKVIIKFNVADPKAVTDSSSCVYWDFDAAGGVGDWSNKGCTRQKTYNNTIECACDHMTNFAALIDVYAATSKACGVHADVLTVVSYFGCILSIIGLALTIFTYSFFRRLRKELAAKILIQLCIALLCVLIVFLVGIERSRVGPIGCYVVAVSLHYFILAAFLWMLVEAHFMYLAFVKVWSQHGEHELLKCSFIAWGLPAVVVGITMAVNLDNYGGGHYCRIEKVAFYAAFFAPVMCVIFVNLIVFGIIMYKLNTRPDSSLGRDRSAMVQRMKQAVGIMILVGVTWLFGALAISGVRLIFHYLFVFFNSIQGFCIFLFYCLSQKNVRDYWKALLTCQLRKMLYKDKSFYTNTYDRRRCSTASTTHNNTLSLARKKTSTSSGNTAYPSHSMDTLTREFTSFNCSSGTLSGHKEGSKPNNLNNFVPKDCNIQNGTTSRNDIWKRRSNGITGDEQTPNSLTRSHSSETLCSDDSSENYHSYDLVASSEGSLVSLHSIAESQASDNHGFYSFGNSKECSANNSLYGDDSAPSTPGEVKRQMPLLLTKNNRLTVPPSTKRLQQLQDKQASDSCAIPDDFGKLIVNPSRGSVRGVRGVVETSVDTYDEDSPDVVSPQGVRLTEGLNNKPQDKFDSNECIASPTYFAESNRAKCDSNGRNSSTNIRDVCL